ncbi:hypothetical protein [Streptomyces gilvus]|nr:hypothetical protein [Streptomyces sp. CME 23]
MELACEVGTERPHDRRAAEILDRAVDHVGHLRPGIRDAGR